MKYSRSLFLIILVSIMPLIAQSIPSADKLANIRKIYIDDLGKQEGADLVREKIRLRLLKSDRFAVVERPEAADAVLSGAAGVVRSDGVAIGNADTSFQGTGVLRLVDVKTEEVVWIFEYKRGFMLAGSVTSRVADQVVDKLLKDAMPLSPKKKAK
jgi:hypothetical protein